MKLSAELGKWRCDRPDEWKMDEFQRNAEKLEAERDALAAQVEALREAITAAVYGSKLDDCGNRDEDGLLRYGNPNNICRQLIDALQYAERIRQGGTK